MFKSAGLRSLLLNVLLFLSLVISHHLGGGSFLLTPSLFLVFALSSALFTFLPVRELEGPLLAAILVAFQLIGHMAAPISHETSAVRMLSSHTIAVVLTYFLTKYLDQVICTFDYVLGRLFGFLLFSALAILLRSSKDIIRAVSFFKFNTFVRLLQGRAPPARLCA